MFTKNQNVHLHVECSFTYCTKLHNDSAGTHTTSLLFSAIGRYSLGKVQFILQRGCPIRGERVLKFTDNPNMHLTKSPVMYSMVYFIRTAYFCHVRCIIFAHTEFGCCRRHQRCREYCSTRLILQVDRQTDRQIAWLK